MGGNAFDFPKDTEVLGRFIRTFTQENDLILDFFAGSGTTGHSVFDLNNQGNIKRNFILLICAHPMHELFLSKHRQCSQLGRTLKSSFSSSVWISNQN